VDKPLPETVPLWLLCVTALAAWLCVAVWLGAFARWRQGKTVLPYQPRTPVPWRAVDLLIVLLIYAVAIMAAGLLAVALLSDADLQRPPAIQDAGQANTAHVVARLLAEGTFGVLLVCGLSAVVVAPIFEEFFFRVLLQGWLEAGQRRLRPAMPTLRRLLPGASGPILLSSFLFARVHFRVDTPAMSTEYLIVVVAGNAVASVLAMLLIIYFLRARAGAKAVDFGWAPEKFFADVRLGLTTFAAVAAPIYGAQITLVWLLPKYLAPDPFVLFPFAIILGTLYWRTHRIVPAIVLHMSLNAASLAMAIAWLLLQKP